MTSKHRRQEHCRRAHAVVERNHLPVAVGAVAFVGAQIEHAVGAQSAEQLRWRRRAADSGAFVASAKERRAAGAGIVAHSIHEADRRRCDTGRRRSRWRWCPRRAMKADASGWPLDGGRQRQRAVA